MYPTNNYMPYTYNPMSTPQQRLAMLEQQYPQFAQNPMNPMQPNQMQQPQYLKGRAVTSIDEAKGAMIDLDGSLHIFPDINNKRIYTKQINLDGTATLNTYELIVPVEQQNVNKQTQNNINFVSIDEFMDLQNDLDDLKKVVKQLQDERRRFLNEPNANDDGRKSYDEPRNESTAIDTTVTRK